MTCDEFHAFLYPYLDGELEPSDRLEQEAHLASCPPCAQRLHEEARFREAFRQRMRDVVLTRTRAPDSLRRALQEGLRREASLQRRALLWRYSAAALVLATASGAYFALRPCPHRPFVEDAAQRHARGWPAEVQQSSPEHLEAWFNGKLDHRVPVPRFPNLAVSGARLSNVKDRPAAYITYEAAPQGDVRPRRVGLFVFNDVDGVVEAAPLPRLEVDSSHGYNVALWREGEIVYELVSDLEEEDIRRLVTSGGLPGGLPGTQPPPRPALDVRPVSH